VPTYENGCRLSEHFAEAQNCKIWKTGRFPSKAEEFFFLLPSSPSAQEMVSPIYSSVLWIAEIFQVTPPTEDHHVFLCKVCHSLYSGEQGGAFLHLGEFCQRLSLVTKLKFLGFDKLSIDEVQCPIEEESPGGCHGVMYGLADVFTAEPHPRRSFLHGYPVEPADILAD
jgi:hypothetical protein